MSTLQLQRQKEAILLFLIFKMDIFCILMVQL